LHEDGVEHVTAKHGPRLVEKQRCGYLRPVVIHCESPDRALANTEFMFPFVSVVRCPQDEMLNRIGTTLVGTAITRDERFQRRLIDATHIDRLNLGPVPTIQLDWLQPHEGNIVEFLFRPRAFQWGRL
jgi:acyl-CoA reductase-like NAD-dependent aldehyde dehydrogenase